MICFICLIAFSIAIGFAGPRRHESANSRGSQIAVVTKDDVAVEKSTHSSGRRGVAGTLVVEKIVGAAAEKGMDLKTCAELGVEVNARTRSIGVALTSCTVPAAGSPTFMLLPNPNRRTSS
jgi:phosphoenolpyruvate---glycerone phosphotransferase subunit DhaK